MNRVICANGHFYDGDKYETCPHCAAGAEAIRQDPFSVRHREPEEEERRGEKKRGFFRRREKPQPKTSYVQEAAPIEQTVLLQQKADGEKPQQNSEIAVSQQSPDLVSTEKIAPSSIAVSAAAVSVRDAVSESDDDEKTVGYFSIGRTEPPVGYLVCTAGDDYGRGFPLKTGNNSVGRSVSMDIAVADEKVSREKQAFIMYEPFKREFYMKPGEGTGLCYLNGELVLAPMKMEAFDVILVGDTKLMLVPVCCEKFSWDAD